MEEIGRRFRFTEPRSFARHANDDRMMLAQGLGAALDQTARGWSGPHGLDLDRAGRRAFVACDAGLVVAHDLETAREVARVAIAGEPDVIWYNAARGCLYVAIGQPGVIDVIDCRGMALAERIVTEEGAHTTAFDPQRQYVYALLPRRCGAAVYEEVASASGDAP
jgi:DNA-binding beta-propeller fold protein YncE